MAQIPWNKGMRKEFCKNGHYKSPDNIVVVTKRHADNGRYYTTHECLTCKRYSNKMSKRRTRAKAKKSQA